MSNSTSIRENIAAIRAQIDAAARETGRTGADITLVGASKMNDAAACQEAIAAGIDALGENRVQEMTAKLAEDAYRGAPLHFIGHLQRNKVKQVVGKVALIQSIGSPELLAEVDKQAEKLGIVQDILLEVNIGGDGLLAGGGIVHLAGAHQRDIRPGAARLPCRRVDLGADRFQIFPNRHRLCLLVSFVSKPRAPAGGGCRRVYRMTLPSYSSPDVAMT